MRDEAFPKWNVESTEKHCLDFFYRGTFLGKITKAFVIHIIFHTLYTLVRERELYIFLRDQKYIFLHSHGMSGLLYWTLMENWAGGNSRLGNSVVSPARLVQIRVILQPPFQFDEGSELPLKNLMVKYCKMSIGLILNQINSPHSTAKWPAQVEIFLIISVCFEIVKIWRALVFSAAQISWMVVGENLVL